MQKLLIILFLLLSSTIFAQKNNVSIVLGAHQTLVQSKQIPPFSLGEFIHTGTAAPKIGSYFNVQLKGRFYFKTGLEFSLYKHNAVCDCTQWPSEHDGNGGFVRDPALDDAEELFHLLMQIPLLLHIEFSGKKTTSFLEGGLVQSTSIYSREHIKVGGSIRKSTTINAFEANLIGGRLGAGVFLPGRLSDKIFLATYGTWNFNSLKQVDETFQLGALGLEIGYRF